MTNIFLVAGLLLALTHWFGKEKDPNTMFLAIGFASLSLFLGAVMASSPDFEASSEWKSQTFKTEQVELITSDITSGGKKRSTTSTRGTLIVNGKEYEDKAVEYSTAVKKGEVKLMTRPITYAPEKSISAWAFGEIFQNQAVRIMLPAE